MQHYPLLCPSPMLDIDIAKTLILVKDSILLASIFLFHSLTFSFPRPSFHSTATQLLAPLGCHNTAHITWGDPRTEWTEHPRGQKAAAAERDCYLMVWGDGYHM